ncbi:MAG: DUF554 domain-containing protein [Anaerolineales bacterium]|nr:DUF554 domain-containing protein [Anaerolineales bacterium]
MTGTFLNIATILIGGTLGILFGKQFSDKLQSTIIAGLGLFTAAIGIRMFFLSENEILVLISLLIGGVLGEWWQIENNLGSIGAFLESKFSKSSSSPTSSNFIRGFVTSSLVFCIGPMTILGSIQDGLTGEYELLAIKSVLDGFAAFAFASSLGVGVLFSVIVILAYQGGLSLMAGSVQNIFTDPMINEMSAVGGILLLGITVSSLLEIKKIRVGNFIPALVLAPLLVAILSWLGISF